LLVAGCERPPAGFLTARHSSAERNTPMTTSRSVPGRAATTTTTSTARLPGRGRRPSTTIATAASDGPRAGPRRIGPTRRQFLLAQAHGILGGGLPLERDDHSVKDILPLAGLVLRTLPIHEAATFWLRAAHAPDPPFLPGATPRGARPRLGGPVAGEPDRAANSIRGIALSRHPTRW